MTNDNNTRTKANAVFFSVIMVLSMVAVGFAAAPAAAAVDNGTVTFEDQGLSGNQVDVQVDNYNETTDDNASVVVTYESDGDTIIAGINSTTDIDGNSVTSGVVNVTISDTGGFPGTHKAHLFNASTASGLSTGNVAPAEGFATDTAFVSAPGSSRTAGEDVVYNGTNIYQGEDDLTFVDDDGSTVSVSSIEGTSGNREGTPLQLPIPVDADTGSYDTNGPGTAPAFGVTVVNPTISTAEVQLSGSDLSTVGPDNAGSLQVAAEWNFNEAEDLALTVEDPSGTDITNEVLGSSTLSGSGEQTTTLDLSSEDAGEYTVIFEGNDDITQGSVVQEYTIEVTTDDSLSIDTDEDTVTQGEDLDYTVSGGTNGQFHMVTIDADDFRDDSISTVFRNVGDTARTGFANDTTTVSNAANATYAYAVVEIDGTQGAGSIATGNLDASTVTLEVFGSESDDSFEDVSSADSVDDTDFSVEEGEITIGSPTGEYTIGSEADINGTATSADAVDVYVRDNNDWELLYEDISVDSSDEYEVEDVVLSNTNEPGASLLGQAGSYRYGVVDRSDSNGASTLTTTQFSRASSTTQSLQTVEGELSAQLETINGQINYDIDDQADLTGNAEGQSSIALVFVDRRGNVAVDEISVDNDGTIDEEDYNIPNRADSAGTQLAEGTVTAHFISQSRDNVIGNGEIPGQSGDDISAFTNWVSQNVSGSNLNAEQVRERIISETTEDTASDDLMVTQSFRYAESQTTIQSVYPEEAQAEGVNPVATGETMVVAGATNLRQDDNSIAVEVLNEDGESLQISSTDEWETDGQWSAMIDTSSLETGTYTLVSDDGTNSDRAEVEIVEEREDPDDSGSDDSGSDGSGSDDSGSDDSGSDDSGSDDSGSDDSGSDDSGSDDSGSDDSGSDDSGSDDSGSEDETPGFGAIVALVALIAAALLATRRDN